MAPSNKDSDHNPKGKVALLKETSPKTHKPKGPVVVNGKSAPKGKVGTKCPTKRGPIRGPMTHSQTKANEAQKNANSDGVQTQLRYSLW